MLELLSEPFTYDYMLRAMTVGSLVGGICAFLSAYIILKGWSLIGDALSHSVVPGVALAYMLGLPFAIGAFFAGGLAATTILFLHEKTKLKQDTIIGLIFTSFFGFGLFLVSVSPIPIDVRSIFLGNILSISPADTLQLLIICAVTITCLAILWKDFLVLFFDELHAQSLGQNTNSSRECGAETSVNEGSFFYRFKCLYCRCAANGGCVFSYRDGNYTRRYSLSSERSF